MYDYIFYEETVRMWLDFGQADKSRILSKQLILISSPVL